MLFSELKLEKIIFEARYEKGFLYWDNSGKALADIVSKFPEIEVQQVNVSNVQSVWPNEGITLNFNQLKADVTQDYPQSLETFKEVSSYLIRIVETHLKMRTFTRIGARYTFILPTNSEKEAQGIAAKSNLININLERLQPFGNEVLDRQIVIRMEDESRGYLLNFSNQKREIALKLPKPLAIEASRFYPNVVMFDIDCYTKKLVDVSNLGVPDIIRVNLKTIEDNLFSLIGV